MSRAPSRHVAATWLRRYAGGGPGLPPDVAWAIEVHLEVCARCRARLADAAGRDPAINALLGRVHAHLQAEIPHSPRMPATTRRRAAVASWIAPALLPRLIVTALVVLTAVGLDLVSAEAGHRLPSLVLLLAPVAPLVGVAVAWSSGQDPAHELVVASPRAGLNLVLRRTVAVLIVVIPGLTLAGLAVGTSPARWLVPCLAFTTGALALGEVVGLHRAATGLALAWAVIVVAPSLITARPSLLLDSGTSPVWVAVTVGVAVVLVARRSAYASLPSGR